MDVKQYELEWSYVDDLVSDHTKCHLFRRRYCNKRTDFLACFKRTSVDERLLEPKYSGSLDGPLPTPPRDVFGLSRRRDSELPLSKDLIGRLISAQRGVPRTRVCCS